jgi:regulator of replication initiation timing
VESYTLVSRVYRAEAQLLALQHSLTEVREHLGHALEAERMLRLEVDALRALLSPSSAAPSGELLL